MSNEGDRQWVQFVNRFFNKTYNYDIMDIGFFSCMNKLGYETHPLYELTFLIMLRIFCVMFSRCRLVLTFVTKEC